MKVHDRIYFFRNTNIKSRIKKEMIGTSEIYKDPKKGNTFERHLGYIVGITDGGVQYSQSYLEELADGKMALLASL